MIQRSPVWRAKDNLLRSMPGPERAVNGVELVGRV